MNTRKFRHVEGFRDDALYVEIADSGQWRVITEDSGPNREWNPLNPDDELYGYTLEWALDAVERGVWEEIEHVTEGPIVGVEKLQ